MVQYIHPGFRRIENTRERERERDPEARCFIRDTATSYERSRRGDGGSRKYSTVHGEFRSNPPLELPGAMAAAVDLQLE